MTTQPDELIPLSAPLRTAQQLIEHFHNKGLIVGGIAAIVLGTARYTGDVDVMLLMSTAQLPELFEVAQRLGCVPRIENAVDFARKHRVLLLRHLQSNSNLDVILGLLPFESEAVARGTVHRIGELEVRLPTPEDFVIMKAVAGRDKDMADIAAVVENYPNMDHQHIERWVREFAEALEAPELWPRLARLLHG